MTTTAPLARLATAPRLAPVSLDDLRRLHGTAAEEIAMRPTTDDGIVEAVEALIATLAPLGVTVPAGTLTPDTPSIVALRALGRAHQRLDRITSASTEAVRTSHARTREVLTHL